MHSPAFMHRDQAGRSRPAFRDLDPLVRGAGQAVLRLGVFLGAAVGVKRNLHTRVDFVFVRLPRRSAALVLGGVLWISLRRRWTPLAALVDLVARLRIKRAFFETLRGRAIRMELQASQMFREEGGAVLPAFLWYLATHIALFLRPLAFFYLGWRLCLGPAELGLIFLTSQILLAVQLVPSGAGTLDGGLLAVVAIAGLSISVPQCTAFLLCIRFWDAAVVLTGAFLAARMGMGLLRQNGKPETPTPDA